MSRADQLPQILERAMRVAIAKRGVAVVVIPGDVALQATEARVPQWLKPATPQICPAPADIDRLASFLNDGKKVTLLCGARNT